MKTSQGRGLLTGYRPELNLARAGLATEAFMGLEVHQGRLASIVDVFASIPQVLEIHATVHSTTTLALTTPLHYRAMPLFKETTRESG